MSCWEISGYNMKKIWAALILLLFCLPTFAHAVDTSVPDVKYIWIWKYAVPFTPAEFDKLATYDIVVIENSYADGKTASVGEAARQIVARNPRAKVFPYFNLVFARKVAVDDMKSNDFIIPTWYLHDSTGAIVQAWGTGGGAGSIAGTFVDEGNAAFRNWVANTMKMWVDTYPFAGIAFDGATALDKTGIDKDHLTNVPQSQIDVWNTGLLQTIALTKAKLGGKKIILNNSYPATYDQYTKNGDITLTEQYCYNPVSGSFWDYGNITSYIKNFINEESLGKIILIKGNDKNYDNQDAETRSVQGRMCYAAFLMGYVPGKAYFKFGKNYQSTELNINAGEMDAPIGAPIGIGVKLQAFGPKGYIREFTNGWVLLNLNPVGSTPSQNAVNFTVPTTLYQYKGNAVVKTFNKGDVAGILPMTAVFFLKSQQGTIITSTPTPTPTPIPGDLTDAGDVPGDQVNIFDYSILKQDMGKTGAKGFIPSDIDKNGVVDIFDRNILMGNFPL
jgi:hypothetical protein